MVQPKIRVVIILHIAALFFPSSSGSGTTTTTAFGTSSNTIFTPHNIGNNNEYLSSIAPYNAFCPIQCPDQVFWPQSENDLVSYLVNVQKTMTMKSSSSPSSLSWPLTIRGGGHSYTCQSTSSVGTIIDMRQFQKLKIRRRSYNDYNNHNNVVVVEATVGAGLRTGEITNALNPLGLSLPHGVCSTVGVAGWILNGGSHPSLGNYVNYYGAAQDFVTEIRGVTVRGSVLRISGKAMEIVSRSPYESVYELETMIANANLLSRTIDTTRIPGSAADAYGSAQQLFRLYGANLFIATEFKMIVRQQSEPVNVVVRYPGDRLKHFHHRLYNLLDPDSHSSINCWLAFYPKMAAHNVRGVSPKSYPSLLQLPEEFLPSVELNCLSWSLASSPSSSTSSSSSSAVEYICKYVSEILQETPTACFQTTGTSFAQTTEKEGVGWYPWFNFLYIPGSSSSSSSSSSSASVSSSKVLLGEVIDFVYDLHGEANCSMSNGMTVGVINGVRVSEQFMDYMSNTQDHHHHHSADDARRQDWNNGVWLWLDLWLADDVEWKEECIASTKLLQRKLREYVNDMGFPHRTYDTHLPDCTPEDSTLNEMDWRQRLYGSNYGRLSTLKKLWDPHSQLSFFGGVGGADRNPTTCADQFADRVVVDDNCVVAGVTAEILVNQTRKDAAERIVCNGSANGVIIDTCTVKPVKVLRMTGTPLWVSSLDPHDFMELVAWVLVVVLTVSALIFEQYIFQSIGKVSVMSSSTSSRRNLLHQTHQSSSSASTESLQLRWRLAKLMFPTLGMVALLAIPKQESYGILLFTMALWKFGFPELTVHAVLVRQFSRKKEHREYALYNLFMLIAMLAHHISATMYYVFTFVGLNPFDQQGEAISLFTIIQHLITCLMGVLEENNRILHGILILAALGSEVVLQVECLAYAPVAKQPVRAAIYLFSASHYLLFSVIAVFLFRHGTIPSYYEPPPPSSVENEESSSLVQSKPSVHNKRSTMSMMQSTAMGEPFESSLKDGNEPSSVQSKRSTMAMMQNTAMDETFENSCSNDMPSTTLKQRRSSQVSFISEN